VPTRIKDGARAYAETNGMTLTTAISDLLDRGLEAVENEESIQSLQEQIQVRDNLLRETEARLRGLQALANTQLGVCATCRVPVTAVHVLVNRTCPNGHPLNTQDVPDKPQAASGLDDNQALVLIGAVGLLLGAAYLASNS
jgi:hypothetical protein